MQCNTMKINGIITSFIFSAILFLSCENNPYGPTGHVPEKGDGNEGTEAAEGFVKGADISWYTQMENEGMKFYNAAGKEASCPEVIKEAGFEAIRLRVWVDPADGWCGKEDVLAKAKEAHDLGMKIMIDFHYSDSWADPGKQNPPAAWSGYSASEMTAAVESHTGEVLKALKKKGIDVAWVQVGNEVENGMLWPMGKVKDSSTGSFVQFLNAGYGAAKEVYPESKVILHISNGHDSGLYEWFFGLMKSGNAKYDIIGMSLYPSWWDNSAGTWTSGWKERVDACITNMAKTTKTFGKPVMICETGMPCGEPEMSKEAMQHILDQAGKTDGCLGVFYWEPEAPDGYNNGYGMGAFSNGRPTAALDPFKNKE